MKPERGKAACHRCHGRNLIEQELATENVFTAEMSEFLSTFAAYHAHGIMPMGPNPQDQPATWLQAATFLESALADYRDAERKQAEEKRKALKQKG